MSWIEGVDASFRVASEVDANHIHEPGAAGLSCFTFGMLPKIAAFVDAGRSVLSEGHVFLLRFAADAYAMGYDHEGAPVPDAPEELVCLLCDDSEDRENYTRYMAIEADWDPSNGRPADFETAVRKLLVLYMLRQV
jgi:hypothetical protein